MDAGFGVKFWGYGIENVGVGFRVEGVGGYIPRWGRQDALAPVNAAGLGDCSRGWVLGNVSKVACVST